jgi:hypothetical protein
LNKKKPEKTIILDARSHVKQTDAFVGRVKLRTHSGRGAVKLRTVNNMIRNRQPQFGRLHPVVHLCAATTQVPRDDHCAVYANGEKYDRHAHTNTGCENVSRFAICGAHASIDAD